MNENPSSPDAPETRVELPLLPVQDACARFRGMIEGKTHVSQMHGADCGAIEHYRLHTGMFPFPLEGTPCEHCPRRE